MAIATSINVLLIEDTPSDIRLVQEILRGSPSDQFNIVSASTLAKGLERLASDHVDVILLDLGLPDSQGFDTFRAVNERAPNLPIIILTVSANEELGLKAIHAGAQRFFSKDVLTPDGAYAEMFPQIIHYAIEHKRMEATLNQEREEVQRLNKELEATAKELQESNEALAERVRERTKELAIVNERLTDSNEGLQVVNEELRLEMEARMKAEEMAKEHAHRAETLSRIILRANQMSDLQGAATALLAAAVDLLGFDGGLLYLRNDADGVAELQAWRHASDALVAQARRIPLTLPNLIPIYRGDAWFSETYPDEGSPEHRNVMEGVQVTAVIPLIAGGNVIGHYGVWSTHPYGFSQKERELFETIGREAGTVIARLLAEQALKQSEARLNKLVEQSFDAVFIHSGGIVRFANGVAAHILKAARPEDLVGLDALAFPTDEFREVVKERIALIYEAHAKTEPVEMQFKTVDGDVVDVESMATDTVWEGKPAVYVAFRDITEKKRAEKQLKRYAERLEDLVAERTVKLAQSEEYFRTIFEESSIGLIHYGADGHPLRINRAAATFFGINDVSDIQHLTIFSSPATSEEDKARLRAGHPLRYEHAYDFKAIKERGSFHTTRSDVRYVDLYMLPIFSTSGDSVEGYLAQLVDVTERRLVEDALQDAQRLAAIGQTATMIGHDLRNPLQALQLIVDLGEKYYNDLSPEAKAGFDSAIADKIFSSAEKQIHYMDKIVSDLQDYARPLQLEAEEIHLTAFVTGALALLTIPESISVRIDIPGNITATLDPHLMQRALLNLILNAVQAMPQGGELAIDAAAEDCMVVIRIRDTGEGVPENMKETLFSPLTTGKAKGTGLGLAVVKRIVEAHNGTITFASEEGKGTTFTVTLPQTAV